MKKLLGFVMLLVLLVSFLTAVPVSAGYSVYPDGVMTENIVLHNGSGWYVINGSWHLEPDTTCEFGEDGRVYVPVQYLEKVLGFADAYCLPDGKTVMAFSDRARYVQEIGSDKITVNDVVYDDAAPYVGNNNYVMVPLDTYAVPEGFSFEISYPESYKNGVVTLTRTQKVAPQYTRVHVNKAMQLVTVYGLGPGNKEIPMWYGICSTGMPGQETVEGRFYLRPLSMGAYYGKWYLFVNSGIWIVNCTQISGDYCFHSILYTRLFDPHSLNHPSFYDLGKKATNGCVRMTNEDAGFIYDNCGGLPCDINAGYYSDELQAIREKLLDELPDTAEEYIQTIA